MYNKRVVWSLLGTWQSAPYRAPVSSLNVDAALVGAEATASSSEIRVLMRGKTFENLILQIG